jgi:hypothetical protein
VQTKCHDNESGASDGTEALEIENVAGIFIVLLGGLFLAILLLFFEKLALKCKWHFYDLKKEQKKVRRVIFTLMS